MKITGKIRVKVTQAWPSEKKKNLRVVAAMEGAICDAEQRFCLRIVSVLAIAFKQAEGRDEVSLLHKVSGLGQPELLLLLPGLHFGSHLLVSLDGRSGSREHFFTIIALI